MRFSSFLAVCAAACASAHMMDRSMIFHASSQGELIMTRAAGQDPVVLVLASEDDLDEFGDLLTDCSSSHHTGCLDCQDPAAAVSGSANDLEKRQNDLPNLFGANNNNQTSPASSAVSSLVSSGAVSSVAAPTSSSVASSTSSTTSSVASVSSVSSSSSVKSTSTTSPTVSSWSSAWTTSTSWTDTPSSASSSSSTTSRKTSHSSTKSAVSSDSASPSASSQSDSSPTSAVSTTDSAHSSHSSEPSKTSVSKDEASTASTTAKPTASLSKENKSSGGGLSPHNRNIVIGCVVGIGGFLVLSAVTFVVWRLWKRNHTQTPMMADGKSSLDDNNDVFRANIDQYHNGGRVNNPAANF